MLIGCCTEYGYVNAFSAETFQTVGARHVNIWKSIVLNATEKKQKEKKNKSNDSVGETHRLELTDPKSMQHRYAAVLKESFWFPYI